MRVFGASEEEVIVKDEHVTPSDVLSGRGHGVASHQGNIYYASLIKERKKEYQNKETNCKRKKEIAFEIVDQIRNRQPPGRFLKMKPHALAWVVKNDQFAVKKIAQALRERRSNRSSIDSLKSSLKRSLESWRSVGKGSSNNDISVEAPTGNYVTAAGPEAAQNIMQKKESYSHRRPEKRSIVGSSSRRFAKWMTSFSRLQLLGHSVGSITVSNNQISVPEGDEVAEAMELLSSDNFETAENDEIFNAIAEIAATEESNFILATVASSYDSDATINDATEEKGEDLSFGEEEIILGREVSDDFREAMLQMSDQSFQESMRNLNISKQYIAEPLTSVPI